MRRPWLPEVGTTEGESLALPNVLIDCRRALVLICKLTLSHSSSGRDVGRFFNDILRRFPVASTKATTDSPVVM